ncbi:MAG: DUF1553 domain-containing protein [Bryobacteraceae bacterium]
MLLRALILATSLAAAPIEFNRDIRPILSDRCFFCHGPDNTNRKANLRLDLESSAKAIIAPGDPAKSKLFIRVASDNKTLRMPPAYAGHDKLSPERIALIEQWIREGAKWQDHWSFIPPKRESGNSLDKIVRARLEREGLKPSPEADRRTLIRRVTLDLTGLPPTPAEIDEFVSDQSADAYRKLVRRLLDSPRYAERMAIRWLEAARYADTNGYQTDGVRTMWPWRDWVIDAFAKNMPFDRFTIEQLAGDLLPGATLDQRIATAFHRNHRTTAEGGIIDEEWRVEYVADRVETTAAVWLGLTMGCSRCHDHKYDPMKQRDFYSLFAFFNNVPEKGFVYNFGNEEPYIAAPNAKQRTELAEFDRKAAAARDAWKQAEPKVDKAQRQWEKSIAKQRLDWHPGEGQVFEHTPLDRRFDGAREMHFSKDVAKFNHRDPFTLAVRFNAAAPKGAILTRMDDYFEGSGYGIFLIDGKLRFHYIFRWTDLGLRVETKNPIPLNEWHHVAVTYDGSMKARSGVHLYLDGVEQELNILFDQNLWPLEHKVPLRLGAGGGDEMLFKGEIDDARIYDRALPPAEVSTLPLRDSLSQIAALPAAKRSEAQRNKLWFAFRDKFLPPELAKLRDAARQTKRDRDAFYAKLPTVMVMEEGPKRQAFVLKRGAYDAHGDPVDAAVPAFLPQLKPGETPNRLALARWLVSRENPLTARVIVNRFWQMLFGTGLVKTVEDFGSQGEWPVQPELLDWLAVEFIESGWDVKRLIETIVTSDTYRQASRVTPELLQRDPENRLLARGPRFRLAPEMIRDQALAVSGLLQPAVGGPPVRPYQPPGLWNELAGGKEYVADDGPGLYRRSLYTYWRRTIQPPSMIIFDSPTRETCAVRENRTNTPLQALALMNEVTYVEAARKLAERMLAEGGATPAERIRFGYSVTLGRAPKPRESEISLRLFDQLLTGYAKNPKSAGEFLAQGKSPIASAAPKPELAAYAGIASLLLNLDETVTLQ